MFGNIKQVNIFTMSRFSVVFPYALSLCLFVHIMLSQYYDEMHHEKTHQYPKNYRSELHIQTEEQGERNGKLEGRKVVRGAVGGVFRNKYIVLPPFNCSSTTHQRRKDIDCVALINGDSEAVTEALKANPDIHTSDQSFMVSIKSCNDLYALGYVTDTLTSEEAMYPIAYTILLYKNVMEFERLLRAVYRPQHAFCIHVDANSPLSLHKNIARITDCFPNVHTALDSVPVVYAGFSRLEAELNCMRDLLASPVKWTYYINLASQAFPLKTNLDIVRQLKAFGGVNNIYSLPGSKVEHLKSRWEHIWEEGQAGKDGSRAKMIDTKLKMPPPPRNMNISKGTAYGAFTRGLLEYVLLDETGKELVEWLKKTYSPDETLWATLHDLNNNPMLETPGGWKGDIDKNNGRYKTSYTAWCYLEGRCQSGKCVRNMCVFGIKDLPNLVKKKELFANKFYYDFEPAALDCLEEYLWNKTFPNCQTT